MAIARRFFVGGNFKMNGSKESIKQIIENLNTAKLDPDVEVVIAPPTLYLQHALSLLPPTANIALSAQNVFDKPNGAFTGEVSVAQLLDLGVKWTLVGHSERRTHLAEDDSFVASKTAAALDGGLNVIWCCGESLGQREAGETISVVTRQLESLYSKVANKASWNQQLVLAYEPIWAIGTGKVATTSQAQEVHGAMRHWLKKEMGAEVSQRVRIIYGGSVTEENCTALSGEEDIDGFLVGGASLKPGFVKIVNCLSKT